MTSITRRLLALAAPALIGLAGCASTSSAPAFADVAGLVEARSGHHLSWSQASADDRSVEAALDGLLARELTADSAVGIALLGNPELHATFEDLSIAQADLVQAGLLSNPMIGAAAEGSLFTLSIEQSFLDLLTLPMRTRLAATELEAAKLRVGNQVLALAAEVRAGFYTAQAAQQTVAMRRAVSEAAEAAADLATRQNEAGTLNDLSLNGELALASQVKIELRRSEGEAVQARERLTRLLGLWGARAAYRLPVRLPELPAADPPLDRLETLAIDERLDVAAARREVQAIGEALSLASTFRWATFVSLQVEVARERGQTHVSFGPGASIELPLFDQKQAVVARLEALKRASEAHLRALSVDARSEVRVARARLQLARALVQEYGAVLIPARERVVALSQRHHDAMLIGIYQLLEARRSELTSYAEYIEALRDYWLARSELERAVGTTLAAVGPVHRSKEISSGLPMVVTPPPPRSRAKIPSPAGLID